jgi:hypothetical protein
VSRVDPLRFAVLLPTLWAAHNVGDHIAQTDGFAQMTTPLNGPYLADQALHHGCLLLTAFVGELVRGGIHPGHRL